MQVGFDDLRQGDFVKATVGNERIWFEVLSHVDQPSNAVLCVLANTPSQCVFDGRVTLDRNWIVDTLRKPEKPRLAVVN